MKEEAFEKKMKKDNKPQQCEHGKNTPKPRKVDVRSSSVLKQNTASVDARTFTLKRYFADKGVRERRVIPFVLIAVAVFCIVTPPRSGSMLFTIAALIVCIVYDNRLINIPVLIIDEEEGVITISGKKWLFSEVKSWRLTKWKTLSFSLLPVDAKNRTKLQYSDLVLKRFKSDVKADMLATLEKHFGPPQIV